MDDLIWMSEDEGLGKIRHMISQIEVNSGMAALRTCRLIQTMADGDEYRTFTMNEPR
jgi:hypothetical protein